MRKLILLIFILSQLLGSADAATIYIDGSMAGDCTGGDYSIVNRNCTGSDGNGYNDIAAALAASSASDTIYVRTGNITSNVSGTDGISIKAGQTWATYPGDMPSRATITGGGSHTKVFLGSGWTNYTIKDLIIVGGTFHGIQVAYSTGVLLENLEVSGWNTANQEYAHGILLGDCCGNDFSPRSDNNIVRSNYTHSPANIVGGLSAGIAGGGGMTNTTVEDNRVLNAGMGIWFDVGEFGGGNIIRNNYVKTVTRHCLFIEYGSRGIWHNNICDTPGDIGINITNRELNNTLGIEVYNNTIYNPGTAGIWINGFPKTGSLANLEVKNNIVYRNNAGDFPLLSVGEIYTSTTSNEYKNNLFHSAQNDNGVCWNDDDDGTTAQCDGTAPTPTNYPDTAQGMTDFNAIGGHIAGNIAGDPLFANPAAEDFRLCTAAGVPDASCTAASPAIDAGLNVGMTFNGMAPDIGAEESGSPPAPSKLIVVP